MFSESRKVYEPTEELRESWHAAFAYDAGQYTKSLARIAHMPSFAPQIAYYLERYREGDADSAFHGLLGIEHGVVSELMAEFRAATDTQLRGFLLSVIWQHRHQSVIPLLAEAVFDSEPRVWREALDGLVSLASPASLEALRAARVRHFSKQSDEEEFRRWLEEAIEQTETEARRV